MKPNWLDRAVLAVAPRAGLRRMQARAAASLLRSYEAAAGGRRTSNWPRSQADANTANGPAISTLRAQARDLVRNNPYAKEALRLIAEHTVGDAGIVAKAQGRDAKGFQDAWNRWADSTDCDAAGKLNLAGLQQLAVSTVAEAGEVLVRRRVRRMEDGLALPFALEVLEPDFLDTTKDGLRGQQGGPIIQGVEFDAIGRITAYWLFERHPGSNRLGGNASRRVSASEIAHVFKVDRPGQVRGVSWFHPVLVRMREYDEFEDAQLMRQKIAACFAAFITDVDGNGTAIGETSAASPGVEEIMPGMVQRLGIGQQIQTANPPLVTDDGFSTRTLRAIASGVGNTYEDMVGDYSLVNFSSGRMGRQKHWAHVRSWQWNMMVPQFCQPVWRWACEAATVAGVVTESPAAKWTAPPMPVLEPDKEGDAAKRMVRGGIRTPSEVVREQGYDPEEFFAEYKADMDRLDALGIVLDSDPRRVTQSGQAQQPPKEDAPPQEDNPTPAE